MYRLIIAIDYNDESFIFNRDGSFGDNVSAFKIWKDIWTHISFTLSEKEEMMKTFGNQGEDIIIRRLPDAFRLKYHTDLIYIDSLYIFGMGKQEIHQWGYKKGDTVKTIVYSPKFKLSGYDASEYRKSREESISIESTVPV